MKTSYPRMILVGFLIHVAFCSAALAQDEGDLWVGRSASGQLKLNGFASGAFNPVENFAILTEVVDGWVAVEPGFDANFSADPPNDFLNLQNGASIWLKAAADLDPAFHVDWGGNFVDQTGEMLPLGNDTLHRHPRWKVDSTSPNYEPAKILYKGTFVLIDLGSTGYAQSAPFTLRFRTVECLTGDINNDGAVDFFDIDPFVAVLLDPDSATLQERCAADANSDGQIDFFDIDSFVNCVLNGC